MRNPTKTLKELEEMQVREIKPREAESGTQAYGEVKIAGSVYGDVTIFTNIRERDPQGDHIYAGSPIMFVMVNGEQIMDPVKIKQTIEVLIVEAESRIETPFLYMD